MIYLVIFVILWPLNRLKWLQNELSVLNVSSNKGLNLGFVGYTSQEISIEVWKQGRMKDGTPVAFKTTYQESVEKVSLFGKTATKTTISENGQVKRVATQESMTISVGKGLGEYFGVELEITVTAPQEVTYPNNFFL